MRRPAIKPGNPVTKYRLRKCHLGKNLPYCSNMAEVVLYAKLISKSDDDLAETFVRLQVSVGIANLVRQ